MSKLDELIEELCPDGVVFKRFDEVCSLHARIGWQRLTKAEYKTTGDFMLIIGTDFTDNHEINYDSCIYVSEDRYLQDPKIQLQNEDILITKDGTLGKVAQVHNLPMPATLNGGVFVVRCIDGSLENRFILHYLLSNHFSKVVEQQKTGSTISHLTQGLFSRLMIPVPPLEVQREIVRVLDNFTFLSAFLSAELSARRKQYEYYKDSLLPFEDPSVEWKPLGDICTIVRGASPRPIKNFITNSPDGVNWIKIGDVAPGAKYITECAEKITEDGAKKSRRVKPGDFILSNSMSFGRPYILQIEGCIHDGWLAISDFDEYVSPDYLYHILTSSYIQSVMRQKASFGGAVQNLNADIVRAIEIPVLSKEQQERVVTILDRFSLLCTDISSGIPAELEARRQQYEYYRDKLLTFKEKVS